MSEPKTDPNKDRVQYQYQYEQGAPPKKPVQNSNPAKPEKKSEKAAR
jgi:hypothetical protein